MTCARARRPFGKLTRKPNQLLFPLPERHYEPKSLTHRRTARCPSGKGERNFGVRRPYAALLVNPRVTPGSSRSRPDLQANTVPTCGEVGNEYSAKLSNTGWGKERGPRRMDYCCKITQSAVLSFVRKLNRVSWTRQCMALLACACVHACTRTVCMPADRPVTTRDASRGA